jgi:hypothetical protein
MAQKEQAVAVVLERPTVVGEINNIAQAIYEKLHSTYKPEKRGNVIDALHEIVQVINGIP